MKETKEYLSFLKSRYKKAGRKEKAVILDEFTKTTGHERKYAIKLLRGWYTHVSAPIKRPRGRMYTEFDANILVSICELFDWIASKRLQPQIAVGIEQLQKAGRLSFLTDSHKREANRHFCINH